MKKYTILALTLVLTATMFTGCRRRNPDATHPTIVPTMPMPTTEPTTVPATEPTTTTPATAPSTDPTDNGNGPLDETAGNDGFVHSDPTETTGAMEGRASKGIDGRQ